MIQDRNYTAFVTNSAKVTGRGMNLMQKIACERKTDQMFVNSTLEALKSGEIEAEAMIDLDPEAGFIPTQKAIHRVPQVYPVVNPTQKGGMLTLFMKEIQVKQKLKLTGRPICYS